MTRLISILILLGMLAMIVGFILWFPGIPDFTPPN